MTYFLEDGDGGYLGDLATNLGIVNMSDDNAPESLKEFLEEGLANEELGKQIIKDLRDNSKYKYIVAMLRNAKYPVIITDGLVSSEDDSDG